ncbi:CHROMATIN REMODELING PROTEIN SHL [Salix purpurea]|uniref:CHROMATIN REMODELING PROTEIN SHL n=1 Tax=Salix purpurea TaxID=77065 RepID=A0A9Q1ACH0_SALPP|nr:CHROMATIN REMODELING PROTEIN SHL [Salix purpurea]
MTLFAYTLATTSMAKAKAKAPRRTLDSYTVKPINITVKPGDCVLMRPSDPSKPSYVAKIELIESRGHSVRVHVRWYYRPEDSIGGRRQFHGSKEVFQSDHYDTQSADTIEGKCTVHSFKNYTTLDVVGNDDFFCRFEYNSSSGAFNPESVAVYCKCEMPYNPDDLMVQCEGCSDWFHPACIEMSAEEANRLGHFFCEKCSSQGQKKVQSSHRGTRQSEAKVETKRRKVMK